MSILGVIVRPRPDAVQETEAQLRALPGVELAPRADAGDPRLVIVIEDVPGGSSAAATLGAIALWPQVLNTSLVYEYSGPESPAPEAPADFRSWRGALGGEGKPPVS